MTFPFKIPREEIITGMRDRAIICVHCESQSNIVVRDAAGGHCGYCYTHWDLVEDKPEVVSEIKGVLVAEVYNGQIKVYERPKGGTQ